jgi:hypothetical protein
MLPASVISSQVKSSPEIALSKLLARLALTEPAAWMPNVKSMNATPNAPSVWQPPLTMQSWSPSLKVSVNDPVADALSVTWVVMLTAVSSPMVAVPTATVPSAKPPGPCSGPGCPLSQGVGRSRSRAHQLVYPGG